MTTEPGQEISWGELHVGSRSIFAAAGFTEVSRPTFAGSSCASTSRRVGPSVTRPRPARSPG
jgi:hypothetical protein